MISLLKNKAIIVIGAVVLINIIAPFIEMNEIARIVIFGGSVVIIIGLIFFLVKNRI